MFSSIFNFLHNSCEPSCERSECVSRLLHFSARRFVSVLSTLFLVYICITAAAAKDQFLLIVKCEMNDDGACGDGGDGGGRVSHEHIDVMTSLIGEWQRRAAPSLIIYHLS